MMNIRNVTNKTILVHTLCVLLGLFICLTPMFMQSFYETMHPVHPELVKILLCLIPLTAVYFCYRIEVDLAQKNKRILFIFLAALSLLLVDIHLVNIDTPSNMSSQYFPDRTNLQFQKYMHDDVMQSNPKAIPHIYRFLPDSVVSLLTLLSDDFQFSKMIYRETLMFLLMFSIYYYSRLYCRHDVGVVTVLLYAALYQISIRNYAGQLTDPLSHLSFILSFIFLELDLFVYFLLTVLIGILAKESIIVMPLLYALSKNKDKHHYIKAVTLVLASGAVMVGIRLAITPDFAYKNISGAGTVSHVLANLSACHIWARPVFFTIGIMMPFVWVSWKSSPAPVKRLVLFLLPILVLTNIAFSWIEETRNYIPAIIPMALMAANLLVYRTQKEI